MNSEIRLHKLSEKDIPGMMEWMHDPEVNRWFRFDAEAMTEERAREFIAGSYTKNTRHYAIVDESDEYLGTISLEEIDEVTGESRLVRDLYITGELSDRDFTCGGFNLSNAWLTGIGAARDIHDKIQDQ